MGYLKSLLKFKSKKMQFFEIFISFPNKTDQIKANSKLLLAHH